MGAAGKPGRAVIVGGGPNGLSAGIVLARAGWDVRVVEAAKALGGGCRTAELTLPGFRHDVCAAVHPMGLLSPALREFDLTRHGLEWSWSELALAHPLPSGDVAVLQRALGQTAVGLGADGESWRRLMEPLTDEAFLQGMLEPVWWWRGGQPLRRMRFGMSALRSAANLARARFGTEKARALFAGCAAHSVMDLQRAGTASFGLMLAMTAHVVGWPFAKTGSAAIIAALERCFRAAGGEVELNRAVTDVREFGDDGVVLFDLNPAQVARIAASALPAPYCDRLRQFPHGPGIFKVDWALDAPIPWKNEECRRAATVHVGGDAAEVIASEAEVARGGIPGRPFVLVAQQSLFDASRAPAGKHTGWAYCHLPAGGEADMTERIEAQLERFAPGFRATILARHTINPRQLEAYNACMVGGDIGGGANDLRHFLFRPLPRWDPYRTPNPRLFLCSSSTPPGGGVHGMCGYLAARSVLGRFP